jgi:antitoxin component of MazEF toxin-antitoxin module
MVKTKFERTFDAHVWKTGNALVITIPSTITKKFKIKEGEIIEVTVKR